MQPFLTESCAMQTLPPLASQSETETRSASFEELRSSATPSIPSGVSVAMACHLSTHWGSATCSLPPPPGIGTQVRQPCPCWGYCPGGHPPSALAVDHAQRPQQSRTDENLMLTSSPYVRVRLRLVRLSCRVMSGCSHEIASRIVCPFVFLRCVCWNANATPGTGRLSLRPWPRPLPWNIEQVRALPSVPWESTAAIGAGRARSGCRDSSRCGFATWRYCPGFPYLYFNASLEQSICSRCAAASVVNMTLRIAVCLAIFHAFLHSFSLSWSRRDAETISSYYHCAAAVLIRKLYSARRSTFLYTDIHSGISRHVDAIEIIHRTKYSLDAICRYSTPSWVQMGPEGGDGACCP